MADLPSVLSLSVLPCIHSVSSPDVLCRAFGMPRRDSRLVTPGDVYFCIRGRNHDGHTTLSDAILRGAACAVLDDPSYIGTAEAHSLPWVLVSDTAEAFLPACLAYCGNPERGMHLYAVTGTNGKTSVTYLLEAIFTAYDPGTPCAVFGTVENRVAGVRSKTENTTPAPEVTSELLAYAHRRGVRHVFLEASSHALAQHRLSGHRFDCGIFTNLGTDHLDYHETPEDYFLCKRSLFFACDRALINTDDPHGRRLYEDPLLCGRAVSYTPRTNGGDYTLSFLPRDLTVAPAAFLAENRLAAAACASMAGIPHSVIVRAIRSMPPIPGRMECVRRVPFSVYLDFAHTPDALRAALSGLRAELEKTAEGAKLHVVFGCGGDRDRTKRPMMGLAAAEYADRIILTADNSRSEATCDIIADILGGIPPEHLSKTVVIEDRRDAIRHALCTASCGDTVLLAGKGHETSQTDRDGVHPFSERDIISDYFSENDP